MLRRIGFGLSLLAAAGCGGATSMSQPAQTPRVSSPAAAPYISAAINVGSHPCAVEGGFGSIWVSVYGSNQELRIDPSTHRVLARIPTKGGPCGIAVGGGSVWVEDFSGNAVTRINPANNTATTVNVGNGPYDATYADGAAWITNYTDNTVSKIEAATGRVSTIKVGSAPTGVAPAAGAVWVTNQYDGSLSRINPITLKVRTKAFGLAPRWTAWGNGSLWIADAEKMIRVDLATGRAGRTVALSGQPNDGDIVGGTVWVTDTSGDLHGIDGRSGKVLGRWPLQLTDPFVLAGYAGSLWVVDFKGTNLEQLDPAKLLAASH